VAVDIEWSELIENLTSGKVKVGFQRGDNHTNEGDSQAVAQVAAYNEFGTDNTPERPFMRPTMFENRSHIQEAIRRIARNQLRGESNFQGNMERVGMWVVNKMRAKIVSIRSPANADSTIAAKGSSNPLIDTAQMKQSVRSKYVND
jgi:hypothetical protein